MSSQIIKNFEDLATSKLKSDALNILETGLESLSTERLIYTRLKLKNNILFVDDYEFNLDSYKKIFFIAIGKCANSSAHAFEDILGDKIFNGIVLDVKKDNFKRLVSEEGTHPFPSAKNVLVTEMIADLLKQATKDDLILTAISGGGSSLMCAPYKMSWEEQKDISSKLMNAGATINELNIVRKHISLIKGGQFSKIAYPAKLVSFILSDVPGDDLSIIASGPTVKDESSTEDAKKILEKYNIFDNKINLIETPKKEKYFQNTINILLGSNKFALESMKIKAQELGYDTYIEDTKIQGEARKLGENFAKKEYLPKSCYLWGGETTVKVLNKDGYGGRNQEFVLGGLPHIQDNMVIAGLASDGWDNSDVAGAIADSQLFNLALDKNLDLERFLNQNNSYEFFRQVGDGHIKTGRTGSNVADIYLVLKG